MALYLYRLRIMPKVFLFYRGKYFRALMTRKIIKKRRFSSRSIQGRIGRGVLQESRKPVKWESDTSRVFGIIHGIYMRRKLCVIFFIAI